MTSTSVASVTSDGTTTTAVATSTTDSTSTTDGTTTTTTAVATSTTDGTTTTGGTTSTTGSVEPEPEENVSGGPGQCPESWGGSNDGSITWYTFSQGTVNVGDVNCSFGIQQGPDRVNHVYTGNGEFFGAMNTADYNTAAACGACVELNRQDTGKSVVVTIVDQCPVATNNKCVSGHIDLSQAAFSQLGNVGDGYVGNRAGKGQVSWKYVPCPTGADVSFRFKEPDNLYWNELLVQSHRAPIQSVEVRIDGTWVQATRQEYNYWAPPENDFGTPPFRVRATDIHGNFVEASLELQAGDIDTGLQLCE
jgi:expansin (peptidoglycan-binding protein)